jgi:hypothetical protein
MRLAVLCLLALMACTPGVDVVARATEPEPTADGGLDAGTGGAPKDPGSKPPPQAPATCGDTTSTVAVLTKAAELHTFDIASGKPLGPSGAVKCLALGASPIALDRTGLRWVVSEGSLVVVEPAALDCKPLGIELAASAMAFVWDPKAEREMLYAIVDGVLVVLDPSSLARTPIGNVALEDVRGLAGTADGRLLAFAGDPLVTIAFISLKDGSVSPTWQTKNVDGTRFAGGVPTAKGFDLVFGARAWTFDPATGSIDLHQPLFTQDPGVIAVASSPCAMFGK